MLSKAQESYSDRIREGEYGYQIGSALLNLASIYRQTKQYKQAKIFYEKTLEFYRVSKAIEEKNKKMWNASIYHQLGLLAQELREYEEARQNYQQALAIFIEFSHHKAQAIIYHSLGNVAYILRDYQQFSL